AVGVRGEGRVAGEDLLRPAALSGAETPLQLGPRLAELLAEVALAVRPWHDASPGDEAWAVRRGPRGGTTGQDCTALPQSSRQATHPQAIGERFSPRTVPPG